MFGRHRGALRAAPIVPRETFVLTTSRAAALAALAFVVCAAGCTKTRQQPAAEHPQKLSEYALFAGDGSTQEPLPGVIPYDLNTPLFSDYTEKFRFVKLPPGKSAEYRADDPLDFPLGTVIAKTFAYPHDARDPAKGRRLLETRILKRQPDGWIGLPYIWNAEQTEAVLEVAGELVDASWIDQDGHERTNNYIIPNANQCKGCHQQGDHFQPLGPKARHLNKDFAYADGIENQLAHWAKVGALTGSPDPKQAPRLAKWDDPASGTLDERARAWLEINCAHCHNPIGPARNAGVNFMAAESEPTKFGIFKTTVAAGRGTGGFEFDIVPGKPDLSIIMFRLNSMDAGIMMPELGKRLIHKEGLELVREWIAAMPEQPRPTR
jgi:uncharacterized repeat protein (TIGR03806 family)